MNIVFVLKQPYPQGMACSKRVHLYAKGLLEHGNNVSIIIPRATESDNNRNRQISGNFEGINFTYTSKSTIRPKSFFKRRISDFLSPLRAAKLVTQAKPEIVFLVSPMFYHILLFKIVSLICKAKYVKEKNEVPYMHKDSINYLQKLFLRITNSFFDGIVMITKELDFYYKNDIKSARKTCIIPIIVEFKGINTIKNNSYRSNKLVYSGALLERKDGILTIIEAFSYVLKRNPELKLYITGNVNKSFDYQKVIDKISKFNIKDKVFFTGYISEQDLEDLMKDADILLLAKPANRQNKYNFPTKVGEYLSSTKPVLISDVGEIINYLKDNESVFISKPDAVEFANKICYILDNYEHAKSVAMNGYNVAIKEFDYKNCTLKLFEFFKHLYL